MRFLCLHGMGTNAQVLENNFATVRYELDHIHTFEFPEGCVNCDIAPDIKVYYSAEDEYYQFYDARSASSLTIALSQLDQYIKEEGPFDGVLGFSQGAALAATYLARLSREDSAKVLPFKCAIFFSGGIPLNSQRLKAGKMEFIDPKAAGPLLELPTANIWGRNDEVWPGSSEVLSELCDERSNQVYIHDEGHSIPGPRAMEAVQGCVRAIRRTIQHAEMMQ